MSLGRPPLPADRRRGKLYLTLAPDVLAALARIGNRSAYIEQLIRRDLARRSKRQMGIG